MWPGPYGEWGSRKYILASLDQSLKRMGVEYFDLFYSHRFDPNTPLDETLGALDTAVKQGKALYAGISSYLPESTAESVQVCKDHGYAPLAIHQPNYSMLNRWIEKSLIDVCETNGLGMIAFCPLFQGLLTDKYLNGIPEGSRASLEKSPLRKNEVSEQNVRVIHELNDHASSRGQTLAQMALSWVLRDHRITSALVGASSLAQIKDNVQSVEQTTFSTDELEKLDRILAKINLPKSLWANE
jgi:L-glyceraldehyde 3-phosphate reductase